MKIYWYRVSLIFLVILSIVLGVYFCVDIFNYMGTIEGSKLNILLDIAGIIVGIGISIFEIYWIIKSFKKGTQILNLLCFNKNREKNRPVMIVSLIFSILFFLGSIWFFLTLVKVIPFQPETIVNADLEVLLYIFLFAFINVFYTFLYTITMGTEDLSTFRN